MARTWYYLGPDNAPHSPEKKEVIAEITGVGEQSANRVIDAKHLAEGKWRIVAAFPPKSGSSQQREISEREFWIGSKVDSAKARATIIEPRDGSLHSDDPVQAFVRYESLGNPSKPKAPGASAPGTGMPSKLVVEVQWARWDEKTDDWADMEFAVTREQAADANFNLWSAGEGKFRIRARGRTSAEFKRPWTPWTTYYVGEAGARLRPHLRDLGSLPGRGSGGAPIPGTRETVRKLRPPPAPSLTTRVSFNRVKIRLGGLLSAQEYGFEHARYSNGQWQGVNAKGYDRLKPPAKEFSVPLTVYSAADKARVRVRAEKPNRGSWSAWKEFVPTPALRAPLRRPPSPAPGGSQQKLRKLLPRP
ncbi:MAG: hypothetical protein ACE5FC_05450 [Myxococcota bacterium]